VPDRIHQTSAQKRGQLRFLISQGVHAKKIAERLGHSSIKLTMDTYGHLFEGSDRESADKMQKLFGSTSNRQVKPTRAKVLQMAPWSNAS
jgi:hypothetical protein